MSGETAVALVLQVHLLLVRLLTVYRYYGPEKADVFCRLGHVSLQVVYQVHLALCCRDCAGALCVLWQTCCTQIISHMQRGNLCRLGAATCSAFTANLEMMLLPVIIMWQSHALFRFCSWQLVLGHSTCTGKVIVAVALYASGCAHKDSHIAHF